MMFLCEKKTIRVRYTHLAVGEGGVGEQVSAFNRFTLNPFTPESDQCQNSPAASQEIWHHTVWRTWLFIAYSDEKWLYYKFSLHHSYNRFLKDWENTLFELRSERVKSRGGEWFPENHASRKILTRSRNLSNLSTESQRLFFSRLVQKSLESQAWIFKQGSWRLCESRILPFAIPTSDQFQISSAASPAIYHHTVWRNWPSIAYSNERWLYDYSHYFTRTFHKKLLGEFTFWTWEWKSNRTRCLDGGLSGEVPQQSNTIWPYRPVLLLYGVWKLAAVLAGSSWFLQSCPALWAWADSPWTEPTSLPCRTGTRQACTWGLVMEGVMSRCFHSTRHVACIKEIQTCEMRFGNIVGRCINRELQQTSRVTATQGKGIKCVSIFLTLSLLRVINVKISLQPHKKYDITQYGELDFS